MSRLLKVYLRNIFKQKGYYVCTGISLLIGVIIPFIISLFIKSTDTITLASRIVDSFKVDIIIVIYITLFVCSDFTDGTAKNFIARGYSRRQILYGKYLASLIAVGVYFLGCLAFTLAFFAKDGLNFTISDLYMILAAIATAVASTGLYVIVANTAEKVSTGIAVNIIMFSFFSLLLEGLTTLLKLNINLSNYWITGLTSLMGEKAVLVDLFKVICIAAVYLVLLFEISNFIIKKKEVK